MLAVYGALMVTLFFASLDQTIVVTALPRIVADLGGLTSYSWIVTAYMLALTVTVPLYGKLVDVHGARGPFIGAIALFLVGSALCGRGADDAAARRLPGRAGRSAPAVSSRSRCRPSAGSSRRASAAATRG